MAAIALLVACASFLGTLVLYFGYARLAVVYNQFLNSSEFLEAIHGEKPPIAEYARGFANIVLVVEPYCWGCRQRIAELNEMWGDFEDLPFGSLSLVQPSDGPFAVNSRIDSVADSAMMGRLAVTATPMIIVFDSNGKEEYRRVAGNSKVLSEELERLRIKYNRAINQRKE